MSGTLFTLVQFTEHLGGTTSGSAAIVGHSVEFTQKPGADWLKNNVALQRVHFPGSTNYLLFIY